jgi:RNA polymerase sigma-70 factor (ECF subfamily)
MHARSDAQPEERAEQALIARAKAGDRSAYEQLLEPAVRPATRLAFAMLHDRSESEDAFQESALRAWRRLRNLREGSRFQPWFMGIVANQCREVRRGRWWQVVRLPDAPAIPPPDDATWLEGEDLRRALMHLPHDQRAAVLLHFHLDMPLVDVATALGITVGGVKKRINRALRRLRPELEVSEVRANG